MPSDRHRYWDDIHPGDTFSTHDITISRQDILEFAAEFDPQPYHLDKEAAEQSIFGGLCASGWHVTALMMRLLTDAFNAEHFELLGSRGVPSLRWRKPVFAGDTLRAGIRVESTQPGPEDASFGYVSCDVNVRNQDDESVITLTTALMIGRALAEVRNG